jgi:hypothetical protein
MIIGTRYVLVLDGHQILGVEALSDESDAKAGTQHGNEALE